MKPVFFDEPYNCLEEKQESIGKPSVSAILTSSFCFAVKLSIRLEMKKSTILVPADVKYPSLTIRSKDSQPKSLVIPEMLLRRVSVPLYVNRSYRRRKSGIASIAYTISGNGKITDTI